MSELTCENLFNASCKIITLFEIFSCLLQQQTLLTFWRGEFESCKMLWNVTHVLLEITIFGKSLLMGKFDMSTFIVMNAFGLTSIVSFCVSILPAFYLLFLFSLFHASLPGVQVPFRNPLSCFVFIFFPTSF